jgi:hypothetical protein
MSIDNNTICIDYTPCLQIHYQYSEFLYEQRLWSFSHWYDSFVLMIFTHNPWITFAIAAFVELLMEGSMVFSVWTGWNWIKLKRRWDSADIAFNLVTSLFGLSAGILFIWIIESPKLIFAPYLDLALIKTDYGIEYDEDTIDLLRKYKPIDYTIIRWKYYAELLFLQFVPPLSFLLTTNTEDGQPLIGGFRNDTFIYFLVNILALPSLYALNRMTPLEVDLIWRKRMDKYNMFYGYWLLVILLLLSPSLYLWSYPHVTMLVGSLAVYVVLFPISVYMIKKAKNIPKITYQFWL